MSNEKAEISLLLYLETRAVDHGGAVDTRRMNEADFAIARRWVNTGYLQFGRIYSKSIQKRRCKFGAAVEGETNWVKLSDRAWSDAAGERRARAERCFAKSFEPNMPAEVTP